MRTAITRPVAFKVSLWATCVLALVAVVPAFGSNTPIAASASVVPRCQYSQLLAFVSTGNGAFDAVGSHSFPILLANVSRPTCVLEGYPHVSLEGLSGVLAIRVEHNASMIFAKASPKAVILRSGAVASFGITYGDQSAPKSDNPRLCTADFVVFSLPVIRSLGQSYKVPTNFDVCRSRSIIGLTPIEVGPVPKGNSPRT